VLSWSYRALDEGPARLFRLLSLHPGRSIGVAAAAALAAEPVAVVRRHLERLAADHLIQSPAPDRYDFHDLLRAYAGELAGHDDEALRRLVDWYIWTLDAAVGEFAPRTIPFPLGPVPDGVTPHHFTDQAGAREWCETEWPNLVAMTRRAAELGWHQQAWRIPDTLGVFLELHARGDDVVEIFEIAIAHAPTPRHRELALLNVAWAYAQVGRQDDGIATYEEVIDLALAAADLRLECVARVNISSACERQARYEEARTHLTRGLALARELGDEHIEAASLNNLAQLSSTRGYHEEALQHCAAATVLFTKLGNDYGVGRVLEQRGKAEHGLGHHDQAINTFGEGIAVVRRFGDRYAEARHLMHLGHALLAVGRVTETRDCWRQALELMVDFDERLAAQLRSGLAELADTTIVELAERRGG
jgi:tetratricopeptide (TPR) repeat protein